MLRILERYRIRINKKPKDISLKRKNSGGIEIRGKKNILGNINEVKEILLNMGLANCILIVNEKANIDDIIEALDKRLSFKPAIEIVTKKNALSINELKEKIWKMLNLIRVYPKPINKPHEKIPVTLPAGSTIKDFAERIGKIKHFAYARVFGKSTKHGVARVGLNHVLADGDIVEVHT